MQVSFLYHDLPLYSFPEKSFPTLPQLPAAFNAMTIAIHEKLTPQTRALLEKIVNAVKKDLAQCWLLEEASVIPLAPIANAGTQQLLIFGGIENLPQHNLSWKKNEPIVLFNMVVLVSDTPSVLLDNVEAKKPLWAGMQEMF